MLEGSWPLSWIKSEKSSSGAILNISIKCVDFQDLKENTPNKIFIEFLKKNEKIWEDERE